MIPPRTPRALEGGAQAGGRAEPDAPASERLSAALAIGSALAWAVVPSMQGWPRPITAVVLATGGLVGMRYARRGAAALALATAAIAAFSALALGILWVWALLAVTSAVLVAYGFRAPWWTRGDLTAGVVLWVAVTVVVSTGALAAWWLIVRPEMPELGLPTWLHGIHPAVIVPLLAAWASINALAEEAYFRGVLQHGLTETVGRAGVLIQAIAFGAFHVNGFPRGASGVILATIYGLMVGALRQRAGGLLAPWIAHVAADAVVVAIIAGAGL